MTGVRIHISIRRTTIGLLAVLLWPWAGGAAVVEEWSLDLDIERQQLVETLYWKVLIEDLEDVGEWNEFPVYLDDHRELLSSEAWVVSPDGDRRKLRRKETDLRDVSSSWELATSRRFLVYEPDDLVPGSRLEVRARVQEQPYYPGTVVRLRPTSEAFQSVRIRVRRGADVEGFRYLLHDPTDGPTADESEADGEGGLTLEQTSNGLQLSGRWAERPPMPDLAAATEREPILYLAWDSRPTWDGVARWYRGFLDTLPKPPAAVHATAQGLIADLPQKGSPAEQQRRRLEALVTYVRAKIRYVAVEVGVGGYRPSPSGETLNRQWGDCKDKSLLLIDLLRHVGIEAYPALIRLDGQGRIRDEFASPFDFNHLIVAVSVEGMELEEGDPVSDGFFFIDPTQTRGSAGYLHRDVQDQSALVVSPSAGRLVRTPILPTSNVIALEVDLDVGVTGAAEGSAKMRLTGDFASSWLQEVESSPPTEIEDLLRGLIRRLLSGSSVEQLQWDLTGSPIPRFEVTSRIRFESFIQAMDRGGSVRLDGFQWAPAPAEIDRLGSLPTALPVASVENRFRLRLPPGLCLPKERESTLSGAAGTFVQRVRHLGDSDGNAPPDSVEVFRRTQAERSWFEGEHLTALKDLAVAEHRAPKRRLRFRCKQGV